MSRFSEFFLASQSSVIQFETFEISHPAFQGGNAAGGQAYRIVRNHSAGITATLETAATATFDYYPCAVEKTATRDNLDFGLRLTFGDLGAIIPDEVDRVLAANT